MRIAFDTGGTFTDCVYVHRGELRIRKVPSNPKDPSLAIATALREVIKEIQPSGESLELLCGTTVGTNALLEKRGGRVALVTTAGFEDVLEIGRQARPKLYDLFFTKPDPLVPAERRIGAGERISSDGNVLRPISDRELNRILRAVRRIKPDAIAICFLFSFRNSANEKRAARFLREHGLSVSVSHEVLPEIREYERTSTAVVNAYLAPVVSSYVRNTEAETQKILVSGKRSQVSVKVMQSHGGIVAASQAAREPVRTILSGPAGGILGASYAAQLAGLDKVISFDMGGTSTDVALLSGRLRITNESVVAGVPISVPMLEIHTVGAGGGSIARFDKGGSLRVGPESAGAVPGPICYGHGTLPTVTDAHCVLGHFANQGLLGGNFSLQFEKTRSAFKNSRGPFRSSEAFAEGVLCVANSVMEKAIRVISIERGYDPRDYTLVPFGGAGGLHACDLSDALEMRGVLLPVFPGALSALGILRADTVREHSQTVLAVVENPRTALAQMESEFRKLESAARALLQREGFAAPRIQCERSLDVRYRGQSYELNVFAEANFTQSFHAAHEQRYGYHDATRPLEIVNVRVRATGLSPKPTLKKLKNASSQSLPHSSHKVSCILRGQNLNASVFQRETLLAGHQFSGPAIITEYSATTLVPQGWRARVDAFGQIHLSRKLSRKTGAL